jgi:uncharacterized protein (TIGR03086 family)
MPLDLPEAHARALASTHRAVAGVRDDQWRMTSNCPEWTVRDLVNHIVSGNRWVSPLVAGQSIDDVGDRFDGDLLGADPRRAYDDSATEAADAFSAPGAMDAPCAVSYGPVPGSVYCSHRLLDVLIHGWDVARSTGQDEALDPELVATCRAVVEPERELLAQSGMFGDVAAPPGASPQIELLAWLGRRG